MTIRINKYFAMAALCIAAVVSLEIFASNAVLGQSRADLTEDKWSKTKTERDSWINIADREQYHIGWIDFFGSTYTRYRDFRKRMVTSFNEGYVFSRGSLEESIRRLSKMKTIYPISMDDVQVILDKKNKVIHFAINVKQKPRH